jgi:hypothetical protein
MSLDRDTDGDHKSATKPSKIQAPAAEFKKESVAIPELKTVITRTNEAYRQHLLDQAVRRQKDEEHAGLQKKELAELKNL